MLFIAVVALLSSQGVATAEPVAPAGREASTTSPVTIPAPVRHDLSPLALSCPLGNLCAWPVSDGSSNRCSWFNADNDWWTSPTVCSWASSRTVNAVYSNGTSANAGVCLYPAANYGGNTAYFVAQGQQAPGFPGVRIRSHRWDADGWCF